MIVPSAEQPGLQRDLGLDRGRRGQSELGQVEHGVLFICTNQPDEVIEDLRYPECREGCVFVRLHELLDLRPRPVHP